MAMIAEYSSNFKPFNGNSDVSIWVKNSRMGRYKQSSIQKSDIVPHLSWKQVEFPLCKHQTIMLILKRIKNKLSATNVTSTLLNDLLKEIEYFLKWFSMILELAEQRSLTYVLKCLLFLVSQASIPVVGLPNNQHNDVCIKPFHFPGNYCIFKYGYVDLGYIQL